MIDELKRQNKIDVFVASLGAPHVGFSKNSSNFNIKNILKNEIIDSGKKPYSTFLGCCNKKEYLGLFTLLTKKALRWVKRAMPGLKFFKVSNSAVLFELSSFEVEFTTHSSRNDQTRKKQAEVLAKNIETYRATHKFKEKEAERLAKKRKEQIALQFLPLNKERRKKQG